jgi:CelD/BcsL family acetyltransferase involved in cellulose biosynthesis
MLPLIADMRCVNLARCHIPLAHQLDYPAHQKETAVHTDANRLAFEFKTPATGGAEAAEQGDPWYSALNDTLAAPRFIGSETSPPAEAARLAWIDCLKQDPMGNAFCHPDMALSAEMARGLSPLVYARWQGQKATTLGVLLNRPLPVRLAPKVRVRLSGYKLLESEVVGDRGTESMETLRDSIVQLLATGKAESVFVEDLDVASPLWEALTRTKLRGVEVFFPEEPQPHWWIRFPEPPEKYWDHFSSKTRSKFRQKARKIEEFRCFRGEHEVEEFLAKAHQIGTNTWQSKRLGTRIANSPEEIAFWKLIAHHGAMRSYVLAHAGRPAAFALAEQWRQRMIPQEIGYDQSHSEHSPGTVLLFRILQNLIERDCPRAFDFGYGDADYKHLFGNHQVLSAPIVLVRSSFRPLAVMWTDWLRRRTSRVLRTGLRKVGVLERVRRRYRATG